MNKNICCYEPRHITRKDSKAAYKSEVETNNKYYNYWVNPTQKEALSKKLLPNSVRYKNDDKIIENENLLTWRCVNTHCKMNKITATPAPLGLSKK